MKISVVVPTYNSEKTIVECLLALNKQTYPPHEIMVVDGKSTDSTVTIVKNFENVKLITNKKSHRPGSSRNLGAVAATGEILFFCDSDCIADRRVLGFHVKAYEKRDDISGVKGTIRPITKNNVSNFVQKQIMAVEWLRNLNRDGTIKSYLNTANFSIDRIVFLEKRFNEDLTSGEDMELFIRLRKSELKILYEPRSFVYHPHPTTIEELFKQRKWHAEGLFELQKIYGKEFTDCYSYFSPLRYINFSKDYLYKAVFFDNRLLCADCDLGTLQECRIKSAELAGEMINSDIGMHRTTCLAVAAAILKRRTGIDFELKMHKTQGGY